MNRFFTSDPHFGHENIIKYCDRPFANAEEMDETLIANWNSVVGPNDEVWVLGDIFFCHEQRAIQILRRLQGKLILQLGNHDKRIRYSQPMQNKFHRVIPDLHKETFDGHMVAMCHYPLLTWEKAFHGSMMLHGHCHGKVANDGTNRRYDVGVDAHGYTPVSWESIKQKLEAVPAFDARQRDR